MNESEMALGYVKKKADSRTGKTRIASNETTTGKAAGRTVEQTPVEPIEPQVPKINSTIENFIKDETRTDTTIGEVFGGISQNIADVKDVTVRKMTFDNTPLEYLLGDKLTKGFTKVENGKVIIYTNGLALTSDEIRQNLAHEMEHARQFQKALNGDEEAAKQIEELDQLWRTDKEAAKKHPLEVEAENNKTKLESELSGNGTNGQRYRENEPNNANEFSNERFNSSLSKNGEPIERGSREQSIRRASTEIRGDAEQNRGEVQGNSTADTRPIEEQAKSVKSEETAYELITKAAQTYTKDEIPFKVTLENAENLYLQFKDKGLDIAAIREAISNNDVETANLIAAKQTAAQRLIKDIANELIKFRLITNKKVILCKTKRLII